MSMSNGTVAECYVYYTASHISIDDNYLPCGVPTAEKPWLPCCIYGDVCYEDSLCYRPGASAYHYYVAGCTKSDFDDPSCATHCSDAQSDVVEYDTVSDAWQCCNTTFLTSTNITTANFCENATEETFPAPAPGDLGAPQVSLADVHITTGRFTASPTGFPSTTSTTQTSVQSTGSVAPGAIEGGLTTSTASSDSSNSNLGVDVGVPVGIVGGLAALAGIGYLLFRQRRNKRRAATMDEKPYQPSPPSHAEMEASSSANADTPFIPAAAGKHNQMHEMDGETTAHELPADGYYGSAAKPSEMPANSAHFIKKPSL